jgi:hypothetical protein
MVRRASATRPATMIDRVLDLLFSKRVIINCDREPYLIRWYVIRTKPFAVFIHKFIRSDEDRALHDHPWNFLVIPIWRGYYEHSEPWQRSTTPNEIVAPFTIRSRVLPLLGTRFRRGTYRHRVELLRPALSAPKAIEKGLNIAKYVKVLTTELPSWSIFIRFREWREWGFWPQEGFIQWNKWWQEKCE